MSESAPNQIKIFYEKSPQYRTIGADGIWAGISPQGGVQIAFFTDIRPTPDYTAHIVTTEGRIGDQIDKLEKDGIVRETEVMIVLRPQVAEQLIGLLQQMLGEVKRIQDSSVNQ